MTRFRSRGLALATLLACACMACGGRVDPGDDGGTGSGSSSGASGSSSSTGGSGGGTSGSSGAGSSGSVTVPPCPDEPPAIGLKCIGPQGCAYFTHSGCEAFVCDDSGTWQTTTEGC